MTNEFYTVPICVETLGVWGPAGYKFIKELGRMTCDKTMKKKKSSFKVNSAQEACAKCFAVYILKFEILQIT